MCTAFYNFKLTFPLIISSDLQKQNTLWSQYSCFIMKDTEAQRELTKLKTFNLKSRILSPNYTFSLLITALQFSASHTQGWQPDWAQYRLATWQHCFPAPGSFALFHSSLTLLPFLRDWDINKPMAQHPMHVHKGVSLNWLEALKVSGLTHMVALDLSNMHFSG